jgi:hypothetical protein
VLRAEGDALRAGAQQVLAAGAAVQELPQHKGGAGGDAVPLAVNGR